MRGEQLVVRIHLAFILDATVHILLAIRRLLASNLEYYTTTFFILQALFEIILKNINFILHRIDREMGIWYNIIISWQRNAPKICDFGR